MLNNIAQQTTSQQHRKNQRKEQLKNQTDEPGVYSVDVFIDNS